MIDNIEISTGIALVALSWICCTLYAIARKESGALGYAFWITIAYGAFRFYMIGHSIGIFPVR